MQNVFCLLACSVTRQKHLAPKSASTPRVLQVCAPAAPHSLGSFQQAGSCPVAGQRRASPRPPTPTSTPSLSEDQTCAQRLPKADGSAVLHSSKIWLQQLPSSFHPLPALLEHLLVRHQTCNCSAACALAADLRRVALPPRQPRLVGQLLHAWDPRPAQHEHSGADHSSGEITLLC